MCQILIVRIKVAKTVTAHRNNKAGRYLGNLIGRILQLGNPKRITNRRPEVGGKIMELGKLDEWR